MLVLQTQRRMKLEQQLMRQSQQGIPLSASCWTSPCLDFVSCPAQGRPLKASDLIPLGAVPEEALCKGGVAVPSAWRGAFPADKETAWEVRRSRGCQTNTIDLERRVDCTHAEHMVYPSCSECIRVALIQALGDPDWHWHWPLNLMRPATLIVVRMSAWVRRRGPAWSLRSVMRPRFLQVGVLPGPNAAPDYFTDEDIATFYSSSYSVHYNSCASAGP